MSNHSSHYARRARFRAACIQLRRENRRRISPAVEFTSNDTVSLGRIIEPENLLRACEKLRAEGGTAPGPDGLKFGEVSVTEMGAILRAVSDEIRHGRYRPEMARQVQAAKPSGGYRTLSIRSIRDRVVSRALTTAITPLVDNQLTESVWGFRQGRSVAGMLARLEATIRGDGKSVVITDDIRGAFDHVPVPAGVESLRRHIPDDGVVGLAETIVRGHEGPDRLVGIDQGDPLSPLILNSLLGHCLDGPLRATCPDVTYLRYADNLVFAARDEAESRRALQEARRLLHEAGFEPRSCPEPADPREARDEPADNNPVNLRRDGTQIELLGFLITYRNDTGLEYRLSEEAWTSLNQQLTDAYETQNPGKTARDVICGWLQAYGPALGSTTVRSVVERVRYVASRNGFREGIVTDKLLGKAQDAYGRWTVALQAAVCRPAGGTSPAQAVMGLLSLSPPDDTLRVPTTPDSHSCEPEARSRRNSVPSAAGTTP